MPVKKIQLEISKHILDQVLGFLLDSKAKLKQLKRILNESYPRDTMLYAANELVKDIRSDINHIRKNYELPVANACKKFTDSLNALQRENDAIWERFVRENKESKKDDVSKKIKNASSTTERIMVLYDLGVIDNQQKKAMYAVIGATTDISEKDDSKEWFRKDHRVTSALLRPLTVVTTIFDFYVHKATSVDARKRSWPTAKKHLNKFLIEVSRYDSVIRTVEMLKEYESDWISHAIKRITKDPKDAQLAMHELDVLLLGDRAPVEARRAVYSGTKSLGPILNEGTTSVYTRPLFEEGGQVGSAFDKTVVDPIVPKVPISPKLPPSRKSKQMLQRAELVRQKKREEEERKQKELLQQKERNRQERFATSEKLLDDIELVPLPDEAQGSQALDEVSYPTTEAEVHGNDSQIESSPEIDSSKTKSGRQKSYKDKQFTFSLKGFPFFANQLGFVHLFETTKKALPRSFELSGNVGEYKFVTKPLEKAKFCRSSPLTSNKVIASIKFLPSANPDEHMRSLVALYDRKPKSAQCFWGSSPKARAEFWSNVITLPKTNKQIIVPEMYFLSGLRFRVNGEDGKPIALQRYNIVVHTANGIINLDNAIYEGYDLHIPDVWLSIESASKGIKIVLRSPVQNVWKKPVDEYEFDLSLNPLQTIGTVQKVAVFIDVENLRSSLSKSHAKVYGESKDEFDKLMFVKMYPILREGSTYGESSKNNVVMGAPILLDKQGTKTDEIPLNAKIIVPKGRYRLELYQLQGNNPQKHELKRIGELTTNISKGGSVYFKNIKVEKYAIPEKYFSTIRSDVDEKLEKFVNDLDKQRKRDTLDLSSIQELLKNDFYHAAHFVFQGSQLTEKLRQQLIRLSAHFKHELETEDGRPSTMSHILDMNLDAKASEKVANEMSKICKDLSTYFARRAKKYDSGTHSEERKALMERSKYYSSLSGRSGKKKILSLLKKASAQNIVQRLKKVIEKKSVLGKEIHPKKKLQLFYNELEKSINDAKSALEKLGELEVYIQNEVSNVSEKGSKPGLMKRILLRQKTISKKSLSDKYSVARRVERGNYSVVNHIKELAEKTNS